MSAVTVTWYWRGLGRMGGAARYTRGFDDARAAEDFMTEVNENRKAPPGQPKAPAQWSVLCDDGVRRRLGTADSAYCEAKPDCQRMPRKKVAA